MSAEMMGAERTRAQRLKALAQRCRDLSEMTAVPELTRELNKIAETLDNEAEFSGRDEP